MNNLNNLFTQAFELFEKQKYSESINKLANAENLLTDPENDSFISSIENLKGFNYVGLHEKETARECFLKALNINPSSSQACSGLAELFYLDCRYTEAKTMFEWAVKNNRENKGAVEGLAKVNQILKLPENDNTLFESKEEEMAADMNNQDIEQNAGKFIEEAYELFNKKDYKNALGKLAHAESIFNGQLTNSSNSDFAASFNNMKGFNYLGLNDIDNAKACFQKALKINPGSSQAYAGLGEILFLNEYDEQAKIMFERAVKNNPDNLFAAAGLKKVNRLLNLSDDHISFNQEPSSNDKLKIYHRDHLGKLFNQLRLFGKGAEIGVQAGEYSQLLRNTWKGEELYLIDRWKYDPDYKDIANVSDEKHRQLYFSVIQKFADDYSVYIIRKDSIEASKQFPDEFFDWIYLDADHSFEGCSNDIEAWYPKLKKGGIFSGHDYLDGEYPEGSFGVKSAVDRFISNKAINLYTTEEKILKSWYFVKPGDNSIETGNTAGTNLTLNEKESQKLQYILNEILEASYELLTLKHFDKAIETLNNSEEAFYSQNNKNLISGFENIKGFNYLGLNENDKARKSFETALNINPESSQACSGLGELFYLDGKDKEAKTMYEFAVKNNPENHFAVSGLEKVNKILDYPETHNSLLNYQ